MRKWWIDSQICFVTVLKQKGKEQKKRSKVKKALYGIRGRHGG
jgi:hypothetical protein